MNGSSNSILGGKVDLHERKFMEAGAIKAGNTWFC
jgi:hypothetical protein